MLKLLSLTAVASAALLAAASFSPASAGHYFGHGGRHFGGTHYYGGHRFAHFGGRHYGNHFGHRHAGHWRHCHGFHCRWRWGVYGWGFYDEGPAEDVTPAQAPAPACTCLSKEYLDDGSVRFFDRCTKESAITQPTG